MRKIIQSILPKAVIGRIRNFRKEFKGYDSNYPIAQIYLDGNIQSTIGLNNYFSILEPLSDISSKAKIIFYNEDGKKILKTCVPLKQWASSFVDVREMLKRKNLLSDQGIVTVNLIPKLGFKKSLLKFGYLSSHFFMFYNSLDRKSLSHIHPLSALDPNNAEDVYFQTSQRIFVQSLSHVKLYQMNPTTKEHEVKYTFISKAGEEVVKSISIPANGVRVVQFSPEDFKDKNVEQFHFSISPLPSSNAKPMLMRVFNNGLFSMSHC